MMLKSYNDSRSREQQSKDFQNDLKTLLFAKVAQFENANLLQLKI